MNSALALFPPAERGAVLGDFSLEPGIEILRVAEFSNCLILIPAGALSNRSRLPEVV
jgi:hypothetical protein